MLRTRIGGGAVTALACMTLASPVDAQEARTAVVNGTQIAITAAPWQAYVHVARLNAGCGGVVLDAQRVLTAAHCVIGDTSTPANVTILAGASDVAGWQPGRPVPAGAQAVTAASIRIHPYFEPEPYIADDIAIVTLAANLNLTTPRTKAIGLAPVGGAPPPGTPLVATGYGQQVPDQPANGRLYAGDLAAMSDLACLTSIVPNMTASVLCANGPGGAATCFGDSGGPITAGGFLVGVTSATAGEGRCRAPWPGLYVDVTAPEVRAFIDGSASPPRAPRLSGNVGMTGVNPPVVGSPLTCVPGAWSDGASLGYTFLANASGQALQNGPGAVFTPTAAHVGMGISCAVRATNTGGASAARTAAAPAIVPDRVRPRALLRSARCRRRRCTVRFQAVDPNSLGALRARVTAERRVRTRCRRQRGRCTKVRATRFAVRRTGRVDWTATAKRVPRGRATLRLRVTDAAGNPARGRGLKRRIRVR
jgi:trypsin